MFTAQDVQQIENLVVILGLAIGLGLGWVVQYARFCTLGAISDWCTLGDTARLRMWLLAVATAIAGTQLLVHAALIDISDSFYVAPRLFWLSNILGGVVFGFGMVLASGCGSRTLARIGAGSIKAVIVFLVMAIFAYMTMRGIFAVARVNSVEKIFVELSTQQDLSSILGFSAPSTTRVVIGLGIAFVLAAFAFTGRSFRENPRFALGGVSIGLLIVAAWWVTGHLGFIEEDPNTLEARYLATSTRSIESLTFVAPLAYWVELFMLWSDTSKTFTFSIATVTGVILGSLIHALASRQFRWEGFQDREDLVFAMAGAALMGIGGVIAFGCTIGQGISGMSLLAAGSLLATVSIAAGAWLGIRWVERRA